jgi:acetyl-CoA carboxylase biotin carboxylase subunit
MRVATSDEELVRAFSIAQAEALASFSNGDLYLERLVTRAKHIEVQIAADNYGNAIHLGERDCSLQRRHQKIVEEAPSTALSPQGREKLCGSAVRGAQFAGYQNVGTMEFLLDPQGDFYFIEMNTRLQVEHPVTEMVTGIDVAKLQIRLADGEKLNITQEEVHLNGHAIECRVVAEDPDRDFAPEFGAIEDYRAPGGPGVRVDSHLYSGYAPPPFYDSLLAKIITWGQDRSEALGRIERALAETTISGPRTSIPYQLSVVRDEDFRNGRTHTQWSLARPQMTNGRA